MNNNVPQTPSSIGHRINQTISEIGHKFDGKGLLTKSLQFNKKAGIETIHVDL